MTISKMKELNNLNIEKIQENIIAIRKEIIHLNIKKATKQNIKIHILKLKKRELAQLLTIEKLKLNK